MKTAKIDKLGRIVIPIQYRKSLGAKEGSMLNIEYADGKVLISLAEECCRICGKEISRSTTIPLCSDCIKLVKNIDA